MAGRRRRQRRGRSRGQPAASCRLERYAKGRVLPDELLRQALSVLSTKRRAWVLARFDHILRAHPDPPLDERAAAVLHLVDTRELRIELARQMLDLSGSEGFDDWRVADGLLDLNQDDSTVARSVVLRYLADLQLTARQVLAPLLDTSPDSVELTVGVEDGKVVLLRKPDRTPGYESAAG